MLVSKQVVALGRAEHRYRTRPVGLPADDVLCLVSSVVEKQAGVIAAYVFGSLADGTYSPDLSDVDLAVVTDSAFAEEQYLALEERLAEALGSNRFDLVWLNRVDPVVRFNVVTKGKLLCGDNGPVVNAFERRTFHEYREYLHRLAQRRKWRQNGA